MLTFIIYSTLFLLGISVGSFINVLVDRLARKESIRGRSYCEDCKKQLKPQDLVPIFSYLFLRGRCRYCKIPLSLQYPLAELATGLLFILTYHLLSTNQFIQLDYLNNAQHILDYGIIIPLIFYLIVFSSLVTLIITDLKYGLLYDRIVIPTIIFVLLYKISVIGYYLFRNYQQLNESAFGKILLQVGYLTSRTEFALRPFLYTLGGSLAIAAFFLTLIVITKGRGMGGGDLKLGFLIGLLSGWPNMLMSILLGFLTGAIASIILLISRKKKVGQTVPFGPFLIISCIVVIFYGSQLFDWYLRDILGLK